MHVFMTGASGFVGSHVCRALLARGDQVTALTRRSQKSTAAMRWVVGDAKYSLGWLPLLADCDAVVNLAGESIAGRWTAARQHAIRSSRIDLTLALVQGMAAAEKRPRVLVSTSAVGFYGTDPSRVFAETDAVGAGFLATVCQDWEHAARGAEALGVRTVLLRLGMVLGEDGGAWPRLAAPIKRGVGAVLGDGQAWTSWIYIDDLVAMYLWALDNDSVRGPVNAVAPQAAPMTTLMHETARAFNRPLWLRIPGGLLRLALGGMADEVLLAGQHVAPKKAHDLGFVFRHDALRPVLAAMVHPT